MASVPGFLTKTFEIFSSPEYQECCGWGPHGDTIIIKKIEQFSKQVLPKYFKHSNFQSFVRQLNMYDFHKTVQDPNHGEFQHQYFKQNKPELLANIKRKANNRSTESIKKLGKLGSSNSSIDMALDPSLDQDIKLLPDDLIAETDTVLNELEEQKTLQKEFERRMEDKLAKVEGENQMLKKMFLDSHQKNLMMQERMDKVIKTLYAVYMSNNQQQNPKMLNSSRMPSLMLTDSNHNSSYNNALQRIPSLIEWNTTSPTFQRMNSVDLNNILNSSFDNIPINNNQNNINQNQSLPAFYSSYGMAGRELGEIANNTSFDYAAASVSVPNKSLASFDASYFNPNNQNQAATEISSNIDFESNPNKQWNSDRVTVLENTDSPIATQNTKKSRSKRTKDEFVEPVYVNADKKQKLDNISTSVDILSEDPNTLSPENLEQDKLARKSSEQDDTSEFLELLNRNQNTTLNRLDSLELTLATLLEDMDGEFDGDESLLEPPASNIIPMRGEYSTTNTSNTEPIITEPQ